MKKSIWFAVPTALLLMGAAPRSDANWAAGWISSPFAPTVVAPGMTPPVFSNQTTRQIIRIDTEGSALKLRLTNEFGIVPIRLAAVHVALIGASGTIQPGSDQAVTFSGEGDAWIPTGSPLLSDPVTMDIKPLQRVAISIFYKDASMPSGHHADLMVAPGNQVASGELYRAETQRGPGLVSEIDVQRSHHAPVIVAFGDSITEGAASTPGADMSWPQQLAKRLSTDPSRRGWTVVNAGLSGNRLLHEGFGVPALGRFDRDVLSVAGITHVVLLEGINDIGWWNKPNSDVSAEQIIEAYRQIVTRAHARGVQVIGATILPYRGAVYYTPEGEMMRMKVNAFIRSGHLFDGVIDFEKAMADTADPTRINPNFEPGDHLHPNDRGYSAMAAVVAPILFEQR